MKEYRIKARSADNRRAIIGALEAMGFFRRTCPEVFSYEDWEYVFVDDDGEILLDEKKSGEEVTHTSLDSLLEDIERDRQTVIVKNEFGEDWAEVRPDHIYFLCVEVDFETFDRIAEAVKKVRALSEAGRH